MTTDYFANDFMAPGARRTLNLARNENAIIATGYSETALVKSTQELGTSALIKKPYAI